MRNATVYNIQMAELPKVDLVGVGLNATDTLITLAKFPERGSKQEYRQESVRPGGQVASAMVACQMWGLSTRYVGKLGDDDAARLHERAFAQVGVEAQLIYAHGAASPRSLILIDALGERTVLCRVDERLTLQPEELRREWIEQSRALLIDGHDVAAATLAAQWAQAAGVPVVADLDEPYEGIDTLLDSIDHVIVSRDFPCRLMQEQDLHEALKQMHARYGNTLTAATLGADGVLAWDGARFLYSAAYKVPVVDTTGAGDIFHAGFVYGLLQGWPLERQLDFACAAAAMNCTAEGARGNIAELTALEALLATGERHAPPAWLAPMVSV
jgi:sugar/nucleoside kinase (ribokinase family)